MNKNDLYKDDKSIYRILSIKEKILIIDCIKRTMPYFVNEITGTKITEQDLQIETGRILIDIEELSPNSRKKAYGCYTVISSIIAVVDNVPLRNSMIELASQQYGLSKQTVRSYLCLYLAYQEISVFALPLPKERELTADEKIMRWALNRFFYTRNKNSLKTAFELMLKAKYCDDYGKIRPGHPTFNQFRYFYRKTRKMEKFYISREGIKAYQKDNRPLLGDGVQAFAPCIGTAMLDSTVCDIYLVNEAGEIIGRPVLAVACDANTSLCLGYVLGWEGTTYSLVQLMLCVLSDKVSLCLSKGIEIEQKQWNMTGSLPSILITDGGSEYVSQNFSQITDLGITLVKEPPYRADLKGVVEQFFDVIQSLYKDVLKGKGVIMPDFRQRGAHDYRKDACLTLDVFERIIVKCIVYYNTQRIIENYPFTEEMIGVKPYAAEIWNYKVQSERKNLIPIDKDTLVLTLFPRTTGRFTRYGLKINKLRYHREGYKEQYLQGGEVEVSYNPDNVSTVWIKDIDGSYIAFGLIDSRFADKTLNEVNNMLSKQKTVIKNEQEANYQAKIDLITYIESVSSGKKSNKTKIKGVRSTRATERRKKHKDLGEEINENC